MKRETKRSHHICMTCRERWARFRFRGRVKRDDDHTLCFACYRSQRDSLREVMRGLSLL
jgi:hypothetical protein